MSTKKDQRYDRAMRWLTLPALLILVGCFIAAVWDLMGWGTLLRVVVTVVLAWFIGAVVAYFATDAKEG